MKFKIVITLLLTLTLTLTACTFPWGGRHLQSQTTANEYLQLAAQSEGSEKQQNLLLATQKLLQDHQVDQAESVLKTLRIEDMNENQQADYTLNLAEYRLLTHQNAAATSLLQGLSSKPLTTAQEIRFHRLSSSVLLSQGNTLGSITELSAVDPLLNTDEEKLENSQAILQILQTLNKDQLEQLQKEAQQPAIKGWVQFAMVNSNSSNNQQWNASLSQWQSQYPLHPANKLIVQQNASAPLSVSSTGSQKVALLLPLRGTLSTQAQAIKNGFFAAYFAAKKTNSSAMSDVRVYDTSTGDIQSIYETALREGANFMVGPLTKAQVTQLASGGSLQIPILALNNLEKNDMRVVDNLYQFSLSPIQEAQAVANKAWKNGLKKALILAPKGEWGEQIAQAFSDQWVQLGGKILSTVNFGPHQYFASDVTQALNVDQSQQRAKALQQSLGKKFRYLPQKREDIDVIFLAALPREARQLKPLLEFYFAGNIPVYAPSFVYEGIPNTSKDKDLNGVIFADMPWVINPEKNLSPELLSIRQQITTLWANNFNENLKFYALGVDAYQLISQLNRLKTLSHLTMNGATGKLSLLPNGHIQRQLIWVQMRSGVPDEL